MEGPEIDKIRQDVYCTMFESAIEDHILINYEQKVVAKESKLSVRSVEPYTKTQVDFLNGNQFFGDMNECRMTGSGRYLWADDGSLYEGEFNRPNVIEGRGTFKFKNADKTGSSRYNGTFTDGKFHGKGQLTNYFFKFNGNFDQDKFNGKGNLKCGDESFDGMFAMDKKICGKRVYAAGVFVGDFNDDETKKFGKYEFGNGDVYCGSFERDMFSGFGEYTWHTESGSTCKYIGSWRNNLREGLGTLKIDSTTCVAVFHKNLKTGAGIVLAKDGRVYASNEMFHRDEFLGCLEVEVPREAVPTLRKLLSMEGLHVKTFKSVLNELVSQYGRKADEVYPFQTCWFNLKVNHSEIWKFVSQFPGTSMEHEFTSIEQTIRELEGQLNQLYQKYADFSSKAFGKHGTGLVRIGLWQMMRDLEFYRKNAAFNSQEILAEADQVFNVLTLNSDDPFETVPMSTFVQYLLFITLHTNRHHDYISAYAVHQRSTTFGLFASMFVIAFREFFLTLLKKPLSGMIPRILQDDRTFLTNFLNIINTEGQKVSIRNVFGFIHQWNAKQSINPSKNKSGKTTPHDWLALC